MSDFQRLDTTPNTTNMRLRALLSDWDETDLSPSYQRARCWKIQQCCDLIDSIMHNWPLPLFTLYKLQATDAAYATGKRYECVDGQNRLCAIHAFRAGTPLTNDKGKEEYVTWAGQTGTEKKQYKDLDATERSWFDSFTVSVTTIEAPMDLDSRKAMFMRLQNGTRCAASENLKNSTHPVSQFIARTGLRDKFRPIALGFLRAATGEWLDTLVDCTTLYIHRADADPLESLEREQSEVRAVIKGKSVGMASKYYMPVTEADDATLTPLMDQLIPVLAAAKAEKVKCHKFHVSLLFLELLTGTEPESLTPAILRKWFKSHDKIVTDTKEGGAKQALKVYREQHATLLAALDPPPPPAAALVILPHPPTVVRDATWTRYFGESEAGICQCCEGPLKKTGPGDTWELAHIDARSGGGSNEPENLVPTCKKCNVQCATKNLKEWCESVHPSAPLLRRE